MPTTNRTTATKRAAGKSSSVKKQVHRKIDPLGPARVRVDRWVTDPTTGKKVRLILHQLPGKGKIDRKLIRAAVIKVRDERLAREKAVRGSNSE